MKFFIYKFSIPNESVLTIVIRIFFVHKSIKSYHLRGGQMRFYGGQMVFLPFFSTVFGQNPPPKFFPQLEVNP